LNYSSLGLINAREEFPGDQDSVLFWLQLKGLPRLLLACLHTFLFFIYPRRLSCFSSPMIERGARIHALKMASWGRSWIRKGGEV
jgi:hypothetical protein